MNEQEMEQIVERVLARLAQDGEATGRAVPERAPHLSHVGRDQSRPPTVARPGDWGLYQELDDAVRAARRAYLDLNQRSLALRHTLIQALRRTARTHARELAEMAAAETGLGRAEDKTHKNLLVADKTPGPEILEPAAASGDNGLTLMERAPYGVIAAITPSTNPTSTIINNAISMVSAGNAVVFNVHPGANQVGNHTVQLLNRAMVEAGGPEDLLTAPRVATIESAQALMHHPQVRLLLVTGGPGVVREAMASGKRAICAGPGNPPVVVDESADLDLAARQIVFGAGFDNNVICTDEKELIVVDSVADPLLRAMQSHHAMLLPKHKLTQLERLIFTTLGPPGQAGTVNKAWIGKDAWRILKEIGISAGPDLRLILVETPSEHSLVWTEQLMPVLPVVRVPDVDSAIDLAVQAEHGFGHTAAMYSRNIDKLSRMAREIDCSIFVKNGPTLAGLGFGGEGHTSFSIASPTGEGLTDARTFTRLRRCTLVDHFRIV